MTYKTAVTGYAPKAMEPQKDRNAPKDTDMTTGVSVGLCGGSAADVRKGKKGQGDHHDEEQ